MNLKDHIHQILLDLGTTKDEIASNLLAQSHFGIKGWVDQCPLAICIKSQLPELWDVCVYNDEIIAFAADKHSIPCHIETTSAACDFVTSFDQGGYAHLERTSDETIQL